MEIEQEYSFENSENRSEEDLNFGDSSGSDIKVKRSYSINFKLKAIDYFEKGHTQYQTAKIFGVDIKCIKDWVEKKNLFLQVPISQRSTTRSLKGKHSVSKNLDIYKLSYEFIQDEWRENRSVTSFSLINFIQTIDEDYQNKSMDYLHLLCFYIRRRYQIALRTPSLQFICISYADHDKRIVEFRQNYKKIYQKQKIKDSDVYNMDQTSVYFQNTPNKVYSEKGVKSVPVNLQKNFTQRVSVLLTIRKDGKKLPPFIVFKGVKDGRIDEEVKEYISKEVHCSTQINAWTDKDILEEWAKYFKKQIYYKKKYLLIVDSYGLHQDYLEEYLSAQDTQSILFIPPNCTSKLQPLDVGVNHPFKDMLRKQFILAQTEEVNREKIKDQIIQAWESIKSETIVNSFNKCLNTQ